MIDPTWDPTMGDVPAETLQFRASWVDGHEGRRGLPTDMKSYEIGYRDGENNAHADWHIALDGLMPDCIEVTPTNVARILEEWKP